MNDDVMQEVNRVIGECAGAVSMCWDPRPGDAVFDSTQAATYVDGAVARVLSVMQAEAARVRADEQRLSQMEASDARREERERLRAKVEGLRREAFDKAKGANSDREARVKHDGEGMAFGRVLAMFDEKERHG